MTDPKELLQQEYDAIKARVAKAVKGEEESLRVQFGERLAHLEQRLGIKAPPAETPPDK